MAPPQDLFEVAIRAVHRKLRDGETVTAHLVTGDLSVSSSDSPEPLEALAREFVRQAGWRAAFLACGISDP